MSHYINATLFMTIRLASYTETYNSYKGPAVLIVDPCHAILLARYGKLPGDHVTNKLITHTWHFRLESRLAIKQAEFALI